MIENSYDKYILASATESPELRKIVFFSTMPMEEKQAVQDELGKIFKFSDNPDKFLTDHLLQTDPILLWDRASLLSKYGISDAVSHDLSKTVYNAPHGITVSKVDLLKTLKRVKFPYIPKTVFSRKAAEKLKFPIIAKASNTFQSRGVEKVDSLEDLGNLPNGFTIYQEQIKIAEEYRVVFFCGKQGSRMIAVFRRDPENDKAKELRTNEASGDGMKFSRLKKRDKSDFSWTQIDPRKNGKFSIKEVYQIANFIFAANPTLRITGLDIAVDDKGKHWFIESNTTPGLFSNMVPLMYKFIYEDAYGPMQTYSIKRLQELSFYFASLTMKDEPTFRVEDPNILYNFLGY
jgi:hypothetical protein